MVAERMIVGTMTCGSVYCSQSGEFMLDDQSTCFFGGGSFAPLAEELGEIHPIMWSVK